MAQTVENIANQAIAILTEAPIENLDENSKAARLLNMHFDLTRQSELTKFAWVFATFRTEVEATDLGANQPYRYYYPIPEDCLRILPLTWDGRYDGRPLTWLQDADGFYTDEAGPQRLTYVANLIDPADWSAIFTEAFIAALAIKIAHPLTSKQSLIQVAQQLYTSAIQSAYRTNAIQRNAERGPDLWSDARAGRSYGSRRR